jgi:4-oxalocrotonate tautomerase
LIFRKETSGNMPYVEVHMIEGRTDEQRTKIAKSFTDTLIQVLGVKPEDVWIQFTDMPKTHFATSGTLRSKK